MSQLKPLAFPCVNSNTAALSTTSVTWSSCPRSRVEEPVDAFIDKLTEGQETTSQFIITSLQADSSVALLRAQELTAAITTT